MKKEFIDLGRQPIANRFLNEDELENEFFYNLKMGLDEETLLVSQMETVEASDMFNENYVYHSSGTETMRNHFDSTAERLNLLFSPDRVLEIGSNDGVFIKHFNKDATVAVEPCSNFAKITNEMGYQTYDEFWNYDTSDKILKEHGKQDLIYAANCMCHIHDIEQAFLSVENLLSDNGVFVFEDPSLMSAYLRNSYDQFYDEHVHLFTVTALNNIFKKTNLEICGVDQINHIHGGTNRVFVKLKNNSKITKDEENINTILADEELLDLDKMAAYEYWAENIQNSKMFLHDMMSALKNKDLKLISYGATSKSTTIFNYCNIGTDLIDYIVDTTPAKQGKLSPGMHIPVVSYEKGWTEDVRGAFLGAWNYSDFITEKEKAFLDRGGFFITHVPEVDIITKPTCVPCGANKDTQE